MVILEIEKSVWDMITSDARKSMMDKGDIVQFKGGGRFEWVEERNIKLTRRSRYGRRRKAEKGSVLRGR